MERLRRIALMAALAAYVAGPVMGEPLARIAYWEGSGFTLARDGESVYYDLYASDPTGLDLEAGDVLLTEEDTYLELEGTATGSLIKVAENTSFALKSARNGGGVVEVTYGRVRARIENLTGGAEFWVTGFDTVAGVRGTDFGYDLLFDAADPDAEKRTTVYTFQGAVEVAQLPVGETNVSKLDWGDVKSIIVEADEQVTVSSLTADEPLVTEPLSDEIRTFWNEHPFLAPLAGTTVGVAALSEEEMPAPQDELTEGMSARKQELQRGGAGAFAAGVTFISAGIISYALQGQNTFNTAMAVLGGTSLVIGTGLSIAAARTE